MEFSHQFYCLHLWFSYCDMSKCPEKGLLCVHQQKFYINHPYCFSFEWRLFNKMHSLIPEEEKSGPAAGITTQLTDSWLCHTSNTTPGPNQLLNRSERRLPELLTTYHSSLNLLVAHKHHNVPGTQTKKRGDKSFIERCGPLFNQHG